MAGEKSLLDEITAPMPGAPAPGAEPEAAPTRDPYARAVQAITPKLDQAGLLGSKEGWLRQLGGAVIPQTTPELVAAGVSAANPETLLGKGAWLAGSKALPYLTRAALAGLTTGLAGKATGYDFRGSAETGALGRGVSEPFGALLGKFMSSSVSKQMQARMTSNVADSFKELIGAWLPKDATDQRIIQSVLADEPSRAVGAALNTLKKSHAVDAIPVIDLGRVFDEIGVKWTVPEGWTPGGPPPAPSKLTPGRGITKAGAGTTEPPVAQAGTAWPPVRTFESKLTPGQDLAPFGAVYDAIESKERELGELVAQGQGDLTVYRQLSALHEAQREVVARVKDPQMTQLLKEYGRTKTLRDWLWGAKNAIPSRGEKVVGDLFDPRGNLTPEGTLRLTERLIANAPRMDVFRSDELTSLANSLNWDLAHGAARAEVGKGLGAMMPSGTMSLSGPHFWFHGNTPRFTSVPGWEGEQNVAQQLAPAAVRAILGQVPQKVWPPRRDE
jgi:hypothetical protein